jgi:hypothetical protein
MRKKKPCCICGRWFLPSERVGNRQRACSRPECQRERHRRDCIRWHKQNAHYDREGRLRRKLVAERDRQINAAQSDPLRQVNESLARDLVGLQLYVLIDEIAKVLIAWTRDLVSEQVTENKGQIGKQVATAVRDEIVRARAPT